MKILFEKIFSFVVIFSLLIPVFSVLASATDGTVDTTNKYARFENSEFGRINFGTSEGNVHVTDSAITGYAWGESAGWINLAPTGYGVTNNSEGSLSGYAWGEITGWINFNPSGSGVRVTINSSGVFLGYAWSENFGWIIFNCATDNSCASLDHKVVTDWRPASTRGGSSGTTIIPGGGAPGATVPPPPIVPPPPEPPPPETAPPPPTPVIVSSSGGGGAGGGGGGGGTILGLISLRDVIRDQLKQNVQDVTEAVQAIATEVKAIITSPTGSVVTKTVSTVGVVGGSVVTASALFLNPLSISEIFLLPLRLWGLLLATFNLKKRRRPWGTVYDSVTKQPLDPAYVVLETIEGKEIEASVTDLDGRYGFLLAPGNYRIVANKTNYKFPSEKLQGKISDELYHDLYFGESILVSEAGAIINKNIPLDPIKFDWNEFAKRNQKLMRFYSKHDRLIRKITDISFGLGFVVAVVALFAAPEPYNIGTFSLYIVLLLLRVFGFKSRPYGTLREKATGTPLSFAIVHVFSADVGIELFQRVADQLGRYYILAPEKEASYFLKIDRKNPDGSYTEAFTSPPIKTKKGIIDAVFEI